MPEARRRVSRDPTRVREPARPLQRKRSILHAQKAVLRKTLAQDLDYRRLRQRVLALV